MLAALLTSCAAKKVRVSAVAVDPSSYIDLQPGWRLRVVTPIPQSGADFLGYETAYYAVRSGRAHGVWVNFLSAEINRDGTRSAQPHAIVPLFELPRGAKHVRLIFLTRVSHADHDMAVAAAEDPPDLDRLTRRIVTDPAESCEAEIHTYCAWIPKGIAVTAELQIVKEGVRQWVPAR